MNPPRRITDPKFIYVNAASTNLRRTFARIRREQKQQPVVVVPIKRHG